MIFVLMNCIDNTHRVLTPQVNVYWLPTITLEQTSICMHQKAFVLADDLIIMIDTVKVHMYDLIFIVYKLCLWTSGPNSVMCVVCIDTCSYKANRKNITREEHSAKVVNVLLTSARLRNRRNNDVTPNCAAITKTNMADIYTDAHVNFPDSGNCIRL